MKLTDILLSVLIVAFVIDHSYLTKRITMLESQVKENQEAHEEDNYRLKVSIFGANDYSDSAFSRASEALDLASRLAVTCHELETANDVILQKIVRLEGQCRNEKKRR